MRKHNEDKEKKEKKKIDKYTIFKKIIATFLIAFTVLGTCYTFIYLVINS